MRKKVTFGDLLIIIIILWVFVGIICFIENYTSKHLYEDLFAKIFLGEPKLEIVENSIKIDEHPLNEGGYYLTGQVKNTSRAEADFVTVTVHIVDSAGVEHTQLETMSSIAPNSTEDFHSVISADMMERGISELYATAKWWKGGFVEFDEQRSKQSSF